MNTGYQLLTRRDKITRFAHCDVHGTRSSDYKGLQQSLLNEEVYWAFRCKEKAGHIFLALPDPTAPKTQAEVDHWLQQQRMARIQELEQKGRRINA